VLRLGAPTNHDLLVAPAAMHAVLNAALPLFALILIGFLCGWGGLFSTAATDNLNRFAVYLALPALMFVAMSKITPEQAREVGFAIAFAGGIAITFALGLHSADGTDVASRTPASRVLSLDTAMSASWAFPCACWCSGRAAFRRP
jgi:Membrane transport protein